MTTQHDKAKRWRPWQFNLRTLLFLTTLGRDLAGAARDLIDGKGSESSFIKDWSYCDVLAISDPIPVVGDVSPYQADILYRIIERRAANGKATCVTINVASDEEADAKLGGPTWDRLCHDTWKIQFSWPSHRKPRRLILSS